MNNLDDFSQFDVDPDANPLYQMYWHRGELVKAFRVTPEIIANCEPVPAWIQGYCHNQRFYAATEDDGKELRYQFCILARSGERSALLGDYVTSSATRGHEVIPADEFARHYRPFKATASNPTVLDDSGRKAKKDSEPIVENRVKDLSELSYLLDIFGLEDGRPVVGRKLATEKAREESLDDGVLSGDELLAIEKRAALSMAVPATAVSPVAIEEMRRDMDKLLLHALILYQCWNDVADAKLEKGCDIGTAILELARERKWPTPEAEAVAGDAQRICRAMGWDDDERNKADWN